MENSISVKEIGAIKDEFYLTENNGYTLSFKVTDFEGKEVNLDDLGLKCTSVMYLDEGEINSQDVPSKDGKLQLNVKADALKDQNETELRLFFYDKSDNKPSLIKNFKIKPNYANKSVIIWDYAIEMNKVEDFSEEFYNTIKGAKGDKGDDGKSAYEVAVANGFKGSESEWLAYLKELPNSLKFDAQNLITNGDFSKGTVGFSAYANDSTLTVSNGVLSITGKGNYGTVGVSTQVGYRFIGKAGQKLYIKARMRVTNSDAVNIKVYATAIGKTVNLNDSNVTVAKPLINTWYNIDGFIAMPDEFEGKEVSLFFVSQYASNTIASGKVLEIYRPLAFNVSNTFGKTFIPTIEDIRKYLSGYANSWFDGTVSFIDMKDYVGNLKNEIDQNKNDLLNHVNKDYLGKYDILTDFSEEWNISSDSLSNISIKNDYTKIRTGKSSKKITVNNSAGSAKGIEKITNALITTKTKSMMLKVWVDKAADIQSMAVYFGHEESSWINYARFIVLGEAAGKREKTGGVLRDGWNYVTLSPIEATLINKFDWNAPVKRVKVTITPKTNAPSTAVFDSIQYNGVGVPKIVFTFDDGWKTVYDNAYPKMKAAGIVGTYYVIGQYVDNPSNPLSVDIASLEQMKEMEANGWVHSNHTWQHNYYFGGNHTPESYVETLDKNRLWMLNNGIGYNFDGASHVCYPNGEYDQAVISLMKARGYKSARAAACRQSMPIQIDKKYELTSRNFTKDVTLEQAKKWIDVAIESGGTTFLQFHQIPLDDTTSNGNENPYISWSKDKFLGLIDYVVEKGLADHCMTHAEWCEWAEYNKLV